MIGRRGLTDVLRAIDLLKRHQFAPEKLQAERKRAERAVARREPASRRHLPNRRTTTSGDHSIVGDVAILMDQVRPSYSRGAAAKRLGQSGSTEAVRPLLGALKDSANDVRGSAANALGAIGDRAAVPALCEALSDNDSGVRGSVAAALGQIGDPSCTSPLIALVADPDSFTRSSCAQGLGRIESREAVEGLRSFAKDPHDRVRGVAIHSLAGHSLASTALDEFRAVFKNDRDGINRTNAVRVLALLGLAQDMGLLLDALNDPDAGVRGEAARGIAARAGRLPKTDGEKIAQRLGQFWRACRHGDTYPSINRAIRELPAHLARLAIDTAAGTETTSLPQRKQNDLVQMEAEKKLERRCRAERSQLLQREPEMIARVWNSQRSTLADRVQDDLRKFIEREQLTLWQKLGAVAHQKGHKMKERAMQEVMETFWHGLGRGEVLKEVTRGSGRIDLWASYGPMTVILELKMLTDMTDDFDRGIAQLREYLRQNFVEHGALVLFVEHESLYQQAMSRVESQVSLQQSETQTVLIAIIQAWKPHTPSGIR